MKSLIVLLLSLVITSCSSTKKNRSSQSSNLDLTHVVKDQKTGISRVDSSGSGTAEKNSSSSSEIDGLKTETDESSESITVNLLIDTTKGRPANDYAGAEKIFDVTINGHQIKSSQPIENVIVKNKAGRQVMDALRIRTVDSSGSRTNQSSQVKRSDSSSGTSSDSLQVSSQTQKANLNVTRSGGLSWKFWILAVLIAAGIVFFGVRLGWFTGLIRWFIALFKRRRDPESTFQGSLRKMKYDPPAPPISSDKKL